MCFYCFSFKFSICFYGILILLCVCVHVEFPYSSYWEENNDSGYSDGGSGLNSPTSHLSSPTCQLSPPPSPLQNQSDCVRFVYVQPLVPYFFIPVPLYPSPPAAITEKHFIQEPYLPSPQPDINQQPLISRLIKWSLPPPTIPFIPLPGWEPMP